MDAARIAQLELETDAVVAAVKAAGATPSEVAFLVDPRAELLPTQLAALSGADALERLRSHRKKSARRRAIDVRAALVRGGAGDRHLAAVIDAAPEETAAMVAARRHLREGKAGLMFLGPTGIGKTAALLWLAAHLIDRGEFENGPLRARILRADELGQLAGFSETAAWARAVTADVVLLDDLGTEHGDAKGWSAAALDRFVDQRYAAARTTLVTSNLVAADLVARVGLRVADRLREMTQIVTLKGESLRARGPRLRDAGP